MTSNILLGIALLVIAADTLAAPEYIVLTPTGCFQVAEIVVKKVAKIEVDLTVMEEDAVTVAEAVLKDSEGLDEIPPTILHSMLVEGCFGAMGRTDVPQKQKI